MRGASLVELLVALAIVLVMAGLAARAVIEASDAVAWQSAASELSQRAEALAQLLTADLTAAGAGPRARLASGRPLARTDAPAGVAAADPAADRRPRRR